MQAIAMVLGRVLAWAIGSLIFKILAAFGVGFVVLTGVNSLFDAIFLELQTLLNGLPANLIRAFALLRFDDALSVLASAVSVRVSLKTFGVGGGEIRKLVFNGPSGG